MKKLILTTILVFSWLVPTYAQPVEHIAEDATYTQQSAFITKEEAIEIAIQSLNLTDRDEFLSNMEISAFFSADIMYFDNNSGAWYVRFNLNPKNGDPVPVGAGFSILVSEDGKEIEYSY